MHNMLCSFSKGLRSFVEESAEYVNTETGMELSDWNSQNDTDFVEFLDTSWVEALPFVPGHRYHSDGKFIYLSISFYSQISILFFLQILSLNFNLVSISMLK